MDLSVTEVTPEKQAEAASSVKEASDDEIEIVQYVINPDPKKNPRKPSRRARQAQLDPTSAESSVEEPINVTAEIKQEPVADWVKELL